MLVSAAVRTCRGVYESALEIEATVAYMLRTSSIPKPDKIATRPKLPYATELSAFVILDAATST